MRVLQRTGVFDGYAEAIRSHSTAQDYEYAWAGYQGCQRVLANIDNLSRHSKARNEVVTRLRAQFNRWAQNARNKLAIVEEEFPEFHSASQKRLAERTMLLSQRDFVVNQRRSGAIPNGVSALLLDELEDQIRELRGYNTEQLVLDPRELLLKVPAFSELPAEEIPKILSCLRQRTLPARQDLIQQGSRDGSLYIIARGKVRVLRIDGELTETITELGSGEFVGKGGLADREPHKATSLCRSLMMARR